MPRCWCAALIALLIAAAAAAVLRCPAGVPVRCWAGWGDCPPRFPAGGR
eukprot:gene16766-67204_t